MAHCLMHAIPTRYALPIDVASQNRDECCSGGSRIGRIEGGLDLSRGHARHFCITKPFPQLLGACHLALNDMLGPWRGTRGSDVMLKSVLDRSPTASAIDPAFKPTSVDASIAGHRVRRLLFGGLSILRSRPKEGDTMAGQIGTCSCQARLTQLGDASGRLLFGPPSLLLPLLFKDFLPSLHGDAWMLAGTKHRFS